MTDLLDSIMPYVSVILFVFIFYFIARPSKKKIKNNDPVNIAYRYLIDTVFDDAPESYKKILIPLLEERIRKDIERNKFQSMECCTYIGFLKRDYWGKYHFHISSHTLREALISFPEYISSNYTTDFSNYVTEELVLNKEKILKNFEDYYFEKRGELKWI